MKRAEKLFLTYSIFLFWCCTKLIISTDNFIFLQALLQILLVVFLLIFLSAIFFVCIKYYRNISLLCKLISITLLFLFCLILYLWMTTIFSYVLMYGVFNEGGVIRNIFYQNRYYQFDWYEVLFWNCIFSLHYPLYLFYIIKPFINHIDNRLDVTKKRPST